MFIIGPAQLSFMGKSYPLHTVSVSAVGAVLLLIFASNVYRTARELAGQSREEQDERRRAEKVSVFSGSEA
jgi:hypothetical protein